MSLRPRPVRKKWAWVFRSLAEEDPTFKAYTDEETGQTIIAGMGELHLEIIVDRLMREFKVEANVGAPQVAYKETITKEAASDTKYKRQSGGSGQYGHCKIRIMPNIDPETGVGKGYEFVNAIVGGSIPKEYNSCGRRRYPGRYEERYSGRLQCGSSRRAVRRILPRGRLL